MTDPSDHYYTIAADTLAKCAAYDPWFPNPITAVVEAWAEQIEYYEISRNDMLAGVTLAYRENNSGFRPLPKDIIDCARRIRRDRADRIPLTRVTDIDSGSHHLQTAINELAARKSVNDAR